MQRIIFFDGVCRLCNAFTLCILKIDHQKKFKFASLNSKTAQALLRNAQDFGRDSVVCLLGDDVYTESQAVIEILKTIGGSYALLGRLFEMLPPGFRNSVYKLVARNRYRFAKPLDQCPIPPPEIAERFLS